MFGSQSILPAVNTMKDFEQVMERDDDFFVVLDIHLSMLTTMRKFANEANKKMLLHADLVQGLKSDRYAAEFICQSIRPAGVISTRANMLKTAKKSNLLAIQRVFLLDTMALNTSYQQIKTVEPDVLEVLPGILPNYIHKVRTETGIDVIAGGLITSEQDVQGALDAGAKAVTTSRKDLWNV
ncbi:glycerol-3-phosphate responsive antiterminator [Geomicrobium sediminis]|uniref:Glycerol uptake operon antiterminator regulatory protein n=1 Tax=Geomicrobium sediminis TaxID=1347788 RepID=A0ABS2PA19_9BACL|nr:glycerol-3-phosphate responsive antiterminator [Geomicrobium sediminis]MBM7632201.1 glycerol uptake operon antiterminator [Geomicrobium sediminis]